MPTNEFQIFAGAGGANVISQAAYLALPALPTGFSAGYAYSNQVNKVLRQASTMAAVWGKIINDYAVLDALDQGTTAALEAAIIAALDSRYIQPSSTNFDSRYLRLSVRGAVAFTASGTFTVPTGVDKVRVMCVGAGGAGASCIANGGNYVSGGGGGGGGVAIGLYSVTAGAAIPVTVGAGGTPGVAGGTSSFSTYCSATGGTSPGFPGVVSGPGGAGGSASGGTLLNAVGGYGSDGQAGTAYFAGNGAPGPFGGVGRAGEYGGLAGRAPGAGGGGAYDVSNTNVARSGGNGANGIVIVEYL